MLTLITGANGAGKTAYVVAELDRLMRQKDPRPLVVLGIPDLLVPHDVAPPVAEWTRQVPLPEDPSILGAEFTFPEGALVVIDESQKIYRQRASGSRVPDYVSAIETHRHRGLDLWFVTQHPQLLDTAVRRLVAKHIHVRAHWAGRELLEWSEYADPESASDRARAVVRPFKLPRRAFGLYKSASQHVKVRRRIPMAAWALLVALVVVGVLGWRVYVRMSELFGGEADVVASSSASLPRNAPDSRTANSSAVQAPLSLEDFEPRLRGRPESAPLYDDLREVVALPGVVGCVQLRGRCSCFTGQGTDAGLDRAECEAWLRSPPFSPFRDPWPSAPSRQSGDRDRVGSPAESAGG